MNEQLESLLSQMTLEEKCALVAGATFWTTVPLERLGIPAIKVSDGPNGVRGMSWNGDVTSACFPVGIALAATWNTELVERVGRALAEEARSKGADVVLGPTVNIHRSPLNGRNFECYSEDPYLSARIAVAYISGLQSQSVSACIKHFVCNDSEFERQSISSEVTERALREIYLPPFKAAVQEAGVWALMSSYNRVNGTYASENADLLKDILKGQWGYDGLVMSDWFGTYSTVQAANGGLDLEMPGPARWMGNNLLVDVKAGLVSEATVDDKVRRLLRLIGRVGRFEQPDIPSEQAIDRPEHRALLRETAAESFVLLKNEPGVLPLDAAGIEKLAIIGANAKTALVQGGGSAQVTPHYVVSPLQGIMNRVGESLEVAYEPGCYSFKMLPVLEPAFVRPAPGSHEPGLKAAFFDNLDLSGAPVYTRTYQKLSFLLMDDVPPGITPNQFSMRLSGVFTPAETGAFSFSLVSAGLSRLFINDQEILDNWTQWQPSDNFFGRGSAEVKASYPMIAGESYDLRVDYTARDTLMLCALRLGCLPPVPQNAMERAVKLAAESDVAVVLAGLGGEWESEGYDRANMDLPPDQDELIARVAAANPNTVVVLNTGSPITMPWLDDVAAVLQAWYTGQESGNSIADVLFGDVNPSGKLPQTFPKRLEDNPAFINYPGENGKVVYGEGIFVGYRYYEKKKVEPLFAFGHGLSYTTFAYTNFKIGSTSYDSPDAIQMSVDVTNTGKRAGQEVVQLYVRDISSRLARPEKELKAFAKLRLQPGETRTVTFRLNQASLAYYDPDKKGWVAEAGTFAALVGSASDDIRARGTFELTRTVFASS
jgi:beta-glucosidase